MQSSSGETPDNRVLWGQVDVDTLEYVGPLILWYISVEHTSQCGCGAGHRSDTVFAGEALWGCVGQRFLVWL